jgi:hypothetical protein
VKVTSSPTDCNRKATEGCIIAVTGTEVVHFVTGMVAAAKSIDAH